MVREKNDVYIMEIQAVPGDRAYLLMTPFNVAYKKYKMFGIEVRDYSRIIIENISDIFSIIIRG
jgi:hypothetical protein